MTVHDFNLGFKLLKLAGAWKLNSKNLRITRIYRFYKFFYWIVFLPIFNVLMYVDLYLVGDDLQLISLNCCGTIVETIVVLSGLEIINKFESINNLRIKFEENEKEMKDEKIYLEALREIKLTSKFFGAAVFSIGNLWPLSAVLEADNRKLVLQQWVPIDVRPLYNYLIICTVQTYVCYVGGAVLLGSGLVIVGFLIRIIAEYKLLEKKIRSINKISRESYPKFKKVEKEVFKVLREVVIKHQKILLDIDEFKATFNRILFIQIIFYSSLFAIDGLCVMVISMKEISVALFHQVVYLFTIILSIFILSSYGTRIIQKSEDIVYAAYDTPWYIMTPRIKRSLIILICQAQRAPQIKAGNILRLNLVTYLEVLKITYQVFTLCSRFILETDN